LIQESGSIAKLPKPLGELNEVVAILQSIRPNQPKLTDAELQEAAKLWEKRGLTPAAAEVAARQQKAMAPPASDIEFWSKFKW
jgi:hypothetical protein